MFGGAWGFAGRVLAALAAASVVATSPSSGDDLAGLVLLPPVVSPGEELELAVLDPRRTPPGGRWVFGGAAATEDASRLRVKLPATLKPGSTLAVSYHDSRGTRRVDVRAAQGIRVVAPRAQPFTPRIADCGARAVVGDAVCMCGSFPTGSWDGLMIDGRRLRERVSASGRVVSLRLPADLTPGAHVLAGNPSFGFPVADQIVFVALGVRGSLDREAVLRGERTSLTLEVAGTEEPLPFTLKNDSPGIVSLEGGNEQRLVTSGGAPNRLERHLRGLRRGDFNIGYTLALPPCACADRVEPFSPDTSDSPRFVPGRVLALLAPASADRLQSAARGLAAAHGMFVLESHILASTGEALVVFFVPDGAVLAKAVALQNDPRVLVSQPDWVFETVGAPAEGVPASPLDYARRLIRADNVPVATSGREVTLALIDTAVDGTHRALRDRLAAQADLTGQGWTADVHGTFLAGLIVARPDAGPVPGLAPGAKLVAIKACHPVAPRAVHARCSSTALVRGVDLAIQKGASILNLSVAGPEDALLGRLIDQAVRKGRLVVAAAGHGGTGQPPPFPGSKESVIAVTAVDAREVLYPFSTRDGSVDLAAPGVEVSSTAPGDQYVVLSGTSLATAFVSATAALLLQRMGVPQAPGAVRGILEGTARDIGTPGKDSDFGSGLLDVAAAMARAGRAQSGPLGSADHASKRAAPENQ